MQLLALTYPDFSSGTLAFIQDIRKKFDEQIEIVAPHFTLVFPIEGMEKEEFCTEIKRQASGTVTFSVYIGKAIVHGDEFSGQWLVFPVPDKGNNELMHLHDNLYSGKLKNT